MTKHADDEAGLFATTAQPASALDVTARPTSQDPGSAHGGGHESTLAAITAGHERTLAAGSTPGQERTLAAASTPGQEPTLAVGSAPGKQALATPIIRPSNQQLEPVRGDALDHFIVVDRLGAGGMGVVLAAYDPDLDRKVAIKLLRPDLFGDVATAEAARARLVREAQAMAKLSHPNVITVHEVGTVRGQVFVAMEFVDGSTLRRPRDDEPRAWRETLDLYLQAGRGLAAAHHAGLVHRDFKPDNVLVGRDGRVQVTDFGLVGTLARGSSEPVGGDLPRPRDSLAELTLTGSIMGTPAYMAPEQHAGQAVDARADQFSFCVSLYEALYNARPFAGETYDKLAANVLAGTLQPAPRADVPLWLRRVVLRGLATDPAERFASMDELLDALAYDRRQRRRRTAFVIGGFVVTALVATAAVWHARADRPAVTMPCEGTAELVAGAWDDTMRAKLRAAFDRAGLAYGTEAFTRSASRLDDYTQRWIDQRTEACKATHVRGEQSAALLDQRVFCLDGHLAHVRALTELLGAADAALVGRAVELTGSLPDLAECADVKTLTAAYPPPAEPDRRERAKQLQERIERIKALRNTGRYVEAKQLAPEVIASARALDHPPILASALYEHGDVQRLAGDFEPAKTTLREAVDVAARARDDLRVANSYGLIYAILDGMQNRSDEAAVMKPYVDVAFSRAGNSVDSRALMLEITAMRARSAGKFDEALGHYRSVLTIYESSEQSNKLASAHLNIGLTLRDQGKLPEALESLGRAERIATEQFGANSPITAKAVSTLGATHFMKGDLDVAFARLERALAAQEGALGSKHQDTAETLTILGVVLAQQGKLDRAIEMYERANLAYRAANGPDHPNVAFPLANAADLYSQLGDFRRARDSYAEAHRIWQPSMGAAHPLMGQLLGAMAKCDAALGNAAEAHDNFERALKILGAQKTKTTVYATVLHNWASMLSSEHKHDRARAESARALELMMSLQPKDAIPVAMMRLDHARVLAAAGDRRGARTAVEELLEPARASGNAKLAGDVELELAKLLVTSPADAARANELARAADAHYAELGPRAEKERAVIKAWLGAHP
jgi:serine/threonine-protein kinase